MRKISLWLDAVKLETAREKEGEMKELDGKLLVLTLLLVASFFGQLAFAREKNADSIHERRDQIEAHEIEGLPKETVKRNKLTNFAKLLSGQSYKLTYVRINRYLLNHVDEEADARENLSRAIDWMRSNPGKGTLFSKSLMEALKQFTALIEIGADEQRKCNWQSYNILLTNSQASASSMKRIDKIVRHFSLEHAKECSKVYPAKYKQTIQQMDTLQVERVESFTDDVINSKLGGREITSRDFYDQLIATTCSSTTESDAHVALIAIRNLASEDSEVKYLKQVLDDKRQTMIIREDKIGKLFENYLLEPCLYYVRSLGPQIFLPASFDATSLPQVVNSNGGFYRAWTRFKICKCLVEKRDSSVKELIKFVRKVKY